MLTHPSKKALHEIQEYPELTALAPGFPATRQGLPPLRRTPPRMRAAPESGLGCGLPLGPRAVTGPPRLGRGSRRKLLLLLFMWSLTLCISNWKRPMAVLG